MGYRVNPQTGQLEDDNGNPVGMGQGVPMDQVVPAGMGGPQPGMLAANQRAGADLSQPVTIDRGGNDMMPSLAPAMPQGPVAPPPSPALPLQPPGMVRDTSTTTRTREVPLPQEREAMKRVTADDQAAVGLAEQAGEVEKRKAEQAAEAAAARADTRQGFAGQTGATIDQDAAAVATAKATYDAEQQKLSKMEVKDFWADKSIGQKVAAAISLAMSAVGGALTGRGGNTALDVINKAVDDNYRLQRAQIDVQAKKVEGAKEGIGLARQSHADRIADLELRQAATWNAVGDAAAAKAAQIGTEAAAVTAERLRQDAAMKRDAHLQQWFEGQRTKVTSTSTSVQGTGAAGGVAGKASSEDLAKIGSLDNDIKNIDRMIAVVKANPKAWNEYRSNEEHWQRAEAFGKTKLGGELRGYAQAAGAGDISPEQGLKSAEAKQIHQGLQGVRVGIAKGYGGVITGGDLQAAGSEITTLANDPKQAQETLLRLRDRLANSRDVYMKNRNVQANPTSPAPAIGGAPSGGAPAADPAKVEMARQRLRTNPNDQVAKDWLAAHGL